MAIHFASSYPAYTLFPYQPAPSQRLDGWTTGIQALPLSVLYRSQEANAGVPVTSHNMHRCCSYSILLQRPAASSALCKQHQKLIQTVHAKSRTNPNATSPPLYCSLLLTTSHGKHEKSDHRITRYVPQISSHPLSVPFPEPPIQLLSYSVTQSPRRHSLPCHVIDAMRWPPNGPHKHGRN